MEELLGVFKPEVVHVHKCYVQLSVAPVVVASRNRVPLVQTVQDYEFLSASPFDSEGGRWDHWETSFSYQALNSATFLPRSLIHRPRINRWIAPSESVYRSYLSIGGIESTVIPNFAASSSGTALPFQKRDGVLYLGRLSPEKGIGHILEAARLLPEVRFTIAGDGPLKSEVLDAVDVLPNLVYVGFVSSAEGRKLIRKSLACVLPSLWQEPGALFCLEAMAEGTPVICYSSGGPSEFVSKSRAGVVCKRPDPADLTEAVTSMGSDPVVWGAFSEGGRNGIQDQHSVASYMDSLERVYESAIGDRSAGGPRSAPVHRGFESS